MDQQILGKSISWSMHEVNQKLTVSGINGIENHESEQLQIAINTEDSGIRHCKGQSTKTS